MLAFHALTGSDTTSQFMGIGKRTAWKVFLNYPQLLSRLGMDNYPDETVLEDAEAFVCKLYDNSTDLRSIQKLQNIFFRKNRTGVDSLPPTSDALTLHIQRAHYQAFVWRKALVPCPVLPKEEQSGWYQSEDGCLVPKLLSNTPGSSKCLALTSCSCPPSGLCCSNKQCTCNQLSLPCTGACPRRDYCRNRRSDQ